MSSDPRDEIRGQGYDRDSPPAREHVTGTMNESVMTATATTSPEATSVPIAASFMALGAGVVWSFGAVTARLAKHADAFQYLIWRSVGVLVVMEVMTAIRRQPPLFQRRTSRARWMLSADFGCCSPR